MAFGEASVDIRANFDPLFQGIRNARGMVQSQLSTLGSIGGAAFSVAAGVGLRDLAVAAANVASGFVTANAELAQYRVSLGVMLQDQEKAGKMMKELVAFAAATPFELPGLMRGVQVLKMYGFETEKLIPMLRIIGDAAAASPVGMEQGVYLIGKALGQIRGMGKLMGQEANQLANAGVPVWEILSKQAGKSIAEVKAAIKSGQLDGATTVDMILKGMQTRTGGIMKAQSQEFFGLLSTLKDEIRQFQAVAGGPLFEKVKEGMKSLVDYMRSGEGQMKFSQIAGQMRLAIENVSAVLSDSRVKVAAAAAAYFYLGNTIVGILPSMRAFTALQVSISGVIPAVVAGVRALAVALKAMTLATIAQQVAAVAAMAAQIALNATFALGAAGLGLLIAAFVRAQATGETFGESVLKLTGNLMGLIKAMRDLDATNADEDRTSRLGREYEEALASGDKERIASAEKAIDEHSGRIFRRKNELEADDAAHTGGLDWWDVRSGNKESRRAAIQATSDEMRRIEAIKKQAKERTLGARGATTPLTEEEKAQARNRAAIQRNRQKYVAEKLITSFDTAVANQRAKKAGQTRKREMAAREAQWNVSRASAAGRRKIRRARKKDTSKAAKAIGPKVQATLFSQLLGNDLEGAGNTMSNVRKAAEMGKKKQDVLASNQSHEDAFRQIQNSVLSIKTPAEEATLKTQENTRKAYDELVKLNEGVRRMSGSSASVAKDTG
jgi:tape measure domain-containing protein